MKNSIILMASIAAFAICGCEKQNRFADNDTEGGTRCRLSVNFDGGLQTKLSDQNNAGESNIRNVQIFVFRSDADGMLDACFSAGFDSPLDHDASSTPYSCPTLDCTVGNREVWAVVNGSEDYTLGSGVGNKAALLSKYSTLEQNAPDGLFMIGSQTLDLKPGSASVNLTVRRVCASVVLESVKNDMAAEAYRKPGSFRIKSVYLVNVPAKTDFGLTLPPSSLAPDDWYAKLGPDASDARSALILDEQGPVTLEYGKLYNTAHRFYSYPNDCPPSTGASWSPRATNLVVEAELHDGKSWHECYYPISLYDKDGRKGLERNKRYRVKLTIRRPGSDSPNEPVEFGAVSGSITVASWDTGQSYEETI